VVAARLYAPAAEEPLLRRLRVRAMLGALLDEPEVLSAAARDAEVAPSSPVGSRPSLSPGRSPRPAGPGARRFQRILLVRRPPGDGGWG
jgi:hypothetical protein